MEPEDEQGVTVDWLEGEVDMIADRHMVLAIIGRFPHVRLSMHGHVHANSITLRGGVAYVTSAALTEYPMQWQEIRVSDCEIELRTHQLVLPAALHASQILETRAGRNLAKKGRASANHVVIEACAARKADWQSII